MSAAQAQDQVERAFFLDVVVGQRTVVIELFAGENEAVWIIRQKDRARRTSDTLTTFDSTCSSDTLNTFQLLHNPTQQCVLAAVSAGRMA